MSNLHNNPHLELPPPQPSSPHRPQPQQQQQHQHQQQHQQHIASVYPKLPSQDDLPPSYSVSSPSYTNMPQAPYPQYSPYQQQQQQPYPYPQYQQASSAPQNQQPNEPRPPVMYYGSMAPPNTTHPLPPSQQQAQTQSQSQHAVQPITALKTSSELVQCPYCQQLVYTVLDYDSGLCTGLSVAGLFLAGCHSGGCLIPFIFPYTKDVTHHCPSCKEKIATFTRLERDTRVTAAPVGL